MELAPSEADRAVLRTYAAKFAMARPLAVVADAPDRVAALQAAFAATMQDAQYLSDARKIGLDTNWLGGRELTDTGPPGRGDAAAGGRSPARVARAQAAK